MPIYEFRCNHCGHRFERLQKMSDPDPQSCPECAAEGAVTRLISAVGFRLKGGGWYETDFKKGNQRNVAGSGEEKKQKESTGTEGASAKSEKKEKAAPAADKKQPEAGRKSGGEAPA